MLQMPQSLSKGASLFDNMPPELRFEKDSDGSEMFMDLTLLNHPTYGKTYAWISEHFRWARDLTAAPLEWLWHVDLKISAQELWPKLIDTSRFNRALGLSAIETQEKNGHLHARATIAGVIQEWQEPPWNWVNHKWLICERQYSKGFARLLRVIYVLEPLPEKNGVRLFLYYGWIPRNKIFAKLLKVTMPGLMKNYNRLLAQIESATFSKKDNPYIRSPKPLSVVAQRRLFSYFEKLQDKGFSENIIEHLTRTIQESDDFDVARLQVKRLACEWNFDVDEVLRLFLHATRLGMLSMTWDVVCPHCRGVRSEALKLSDLPNKAFCEVCSIEFGTDKDHAIEVSFHIHPSIRAVPRLNYCTAEASSKTHIWLQQNINMAEKRALDIDLPTGRYRVRCKGAQRSRELIVHRAHALHHIECVNDSFLDEREPLRIAEDFKVHLEGWEKDLTVIIEEEKWSEVALKPGEVFYLQEFRDLFSEEYLSAGVMLSIGVQTILFTDIVGSTQFYAQQGDPTAFGLVKKHFNDVFESVRENNGIVVKTIGDAVMAAFTKPVDAVKAARDINAKFPMGRQDVPFRLRVSCHTGPCIAVRLTQNVDYFGGTVNLASKLQALAEAGEIALSAETIASSDVKSFFQQQDVTLEMVSFSPKSTELKLQAFRWDTNAKIV